MTELSLRFNGYVVRHRVQIGLALLTAAIIGTAIASQGVTLHEVLGKFPF
jgi:hypothetical protein